MSPAFAISAVVGVLLAYLLSRWLDRPWSGVKLFLGVLAVKWALLILVGAGVTGWLLFSMFGGRTMP